MKKRLHRIGILVLFAAIIPSCELLEDCKTCTLITEIEGEEPIRGTSATYCGAQLIAKEADLPVTIGNTTTYYECE